MHDGWAEAESTGTFVAGALSPRRDPAHSAVKRAFDVTAASLALLFFSPILAAIALLVRLESPGPALFRQQRGGLRGAPFRIYKFRTMRVQEDGADIRHATKGDERVTRLGAFLRRSSLDELPQLINVLKGDMSLVGPRPHAVAHDLHYGALLPDYRLRAACKPGLTGLAQVSGLRGDVAELDAMRRRVSSDLSYIDNWSMSLDLKVIVATATKVLFDRAAY